MFKQIFFTAAAALLFFTGCFNSGKVVQRPITTNMEKTTTATSFHTLSANSLEGVATSMEQFKGKKIVVLNVASECGYTPQYADWQAFYESHKDKVVVLGFPCNQFGGQEPGDAGKIATFCQKNYGVTFPLFEKGDVKGNNQTAVYKWLTDPAQNGWNDQAPSWNFCKYLINEKGELTNFFASGVKPGDAAFEAALAK